MALGTLTAVLRLVAARLAGGALTLLLVLVLAFALLEALPGDAVSITEDPSLTAEDRERLRRAYGLDEPPLSRFFTFVSSAARGDLGVSISRHRPVTTVLMTALVPTLVLTGSALLIAFGLGLLLGTRAALRPGGVADRLTRRALPALDAMPPFWLGLLAIWLFALRLGWLPASHMHSAGGEGGALDLLRHLLLPAVVLGLPGAAPVARHHAEAMRRELGSAWVRVARAMGLRRASVARRALGNALHPTIALAGLALPATVGGAVVVEVVFSWPGLGQVHQQALLSRDIPLALGGVLLTGSVVILGGFLADLASSLIDPRWRRSDG